MTLSPEYAAMLADERDLFEAWAAADSRDLEPEQFEQRTPDNNLYYVTDSTNQAYIGWCARAALRHTEASPANERAAIVAWLRDNARCPWDRSHDWLADAIERGDHMEQGNG